MKPPVLDPQGKDQSKRANRPDHEVQYDPETCTTYLSRVLGENKETPDAQANLEALTLVDPVPGTLVQGGRRAGKATILRRQKHRALLTQRILMDLASGEDVIDIADRLGVTTATITGYLARHRREVEAGTIDERLDQIAMPLATDNLIHGLLAGDKDYTLETLKGRGKFRRHTEDTGAGKLDLPVLRISIEVPASQNGVPLPAMSPVPSADQMIAGGRIVGAMRLPKPMLPDIPVHKDETEAHTDALQIAGAPRTPA